VCPAAGLQYSRDVTSWLSDTHVRYGVGMSTDLIKRIDELHDLVSLRYLHVCVCVSNLEVLRS
jgi:hypothetical protein